MNAVRRPRRPIKLIVKVAVTALVLAAVLKVVGAESVWAAVRRIPPASWVVATVLFASIHFVATLKWRLFMRLCGGRIGVADSVRAYGAGLFANLCLPSMIGGDVLRAGLAMQAARQKESIVLGSLVDRFSDMIGLGLLAAQGVILAAMARSGGDDVSAGGARTVLAFFAGVAVVVASVAVLMRVRPRPSWPAKLRRIYLRGGVGIRKLRKKPVLSLAGVLSSALLQLALLLVHRELARPTGFTADLGVWLFVWPLAKLVAMVPISLGGLGVREAAFGSLAQRFGTDFGVGIACSLAWQGVLIMGGLIGGLVWVVLGRAARPVSLESSGKARVS